MAYKDPMKQRAYQTQWVGECRSDWLAKQSCALCGYGTGLRIYRDMGAPRISWSREGPSHYRFRVVCGDPIACARRREAGCKPSTPALPRPKPTALSKLAIMRKAMHTPYETRKLQAMRGDRAPTLELSPKPAPVANKRREPRRLKRLEVSKPRPTAPDRRPVCPKHGPRGTVSLKGAVRFVCCGRIVTDAEPKPKRWWEK